MEKPCVILSTVKTLPQAETLARQLVEKHLAACVSVIPAIRSFYMWKEKLYEESEALLIIKTTAARYPDLQKSLEGLHPYETPEIIGIPVTNGLKRYLDWLEEAVRKQP